MIGRTINNYKILEKLNRSETVGVYKAVDILLNRIVVVKTLEQKNSFQPEIAESLRHEAAILAKLNHSYIPTLHSLTADDDELFMISEFAEGETLDRILLREGKRPIEKAVLVFSQMFDCLEYTHKVGIVHGWLKTSHILLTDAGAVKILGFGASENFPSAETIADEKGFETGESGYRKRVSENKIDKENDIYALAAMLYETLTGKSLFDAEKAVESVISKAVESVISQALSPNSAETFQNVSEFRSALAAAGFGVSDDKITFSPPEKSVGEKFDNGNVSVFTVDFAETENDVLKEESNQNSVQTDELNNHLPNSISGKSGRKRYKIAGAAIFVILVLHSVWQLSFIQSENLRAAEAELKTIQPEKLPVPVKKDKPPVEVKTIHEAKKSDVVISPKAVRPAAHRQSEIKPALPTPKKKAVPESRSERLRRTEKLLTGM